MKYLLTLSLLTTACMGKALLNLEPDKVDNHKIESHCEKVRKAFQTLLGEMDENDQVQIHTLKVFGKKCGFYQDLNDTSSNIQPVFIVN